MNPIFVALLLLMLPYQNMEVGICKMSTDKDFDIAANMGFEWHRGGVAWAGIEINLWGYHFYWKDADRLVNNSVRTGIKMLWPLAFTPWWCSSKGNVTYEDPDYYTYPPNNMSAWYNFVKTIAERYRGKITAWEIWNEEDLSYFWKGSVEEYVELIKYAYLALKEVDENNTVVMGGLALGDAGVGSYNPHFLEEFLELGGGQYVDVYAFHVYGDTLFQRYEYMRNTLEKYGEEKPLWVTEFGASTFEGGYTELGQALYIISGLLQMKNLGIEKVMIYEFRDSGNNASDWESNLGIFRADYSPKMVVFFLIIYLRIAHLMA
jgi:endo-1,4-beta-mannosidase